MAVTFCLSLAAMIYAGPLAPFLSQGIGLTLVGAAAMALIGSLALSYRGTLIQPQDVSTILLSTSAGAIASLPANSAEAAFATVVALAGFTSIATGVTTCAMGVFKLGYFVLFVPISVVSGFLAASGVPLVRGAYGMVVPDGRDGKGATCCRYLGPMACEQQKGSQGLDRFAGHILQRTVAWMPWRAAVPQDR